MVHRKNPGLNPWFFIALHHHRDCHSIDIVSVSILINHCCFMLTFVIVIVVDPSCLCRADGNASNRHGSVSLNATASEEPQVSAWRRQHLPRVIVISVNPSCLPSADRNKCLVNCDLL